ncbi:hypothetical protein D3OALGB2SA_2139 [Olavius algarvensis associated proteobacterium Delta 3]|nr:hypothetical protein D3OALGB2SA_2139 [Olavius algarvensis associated proteobacterium Delta 3]
MGAMPYYTRISGIKTACRLISGCFSIPNGTSPITAGHRPRPEHHIVAPVSEAGIADPLIRCLFFSWQTSLFFVKYVLC